MKRILVCLLVLLFTLSLCLGVSAESDNTVRFNNLKSFAEKYETNVVLSGLGAFWLKPPDTRGEVGEGVGTRPIIKADKPIGCYSYDLAVRSPMYKDIDTNHKGMLSGYSVSFKYFYDSDKDKLLQRVRISNGDTSVYYAVLVWYDAGVFAIVG